MARKRTKKNLNNIMDDGDSQAAGFFGDSAPAQPTRSTRVVAIPLSQCVPDRFQARIILPPDIKLRFFNGEMDCYQAAGSLLEAQEYDEGIRPQVADLLALGLNILDIGQIEPATGSWIAGPGGGMVFALEVGERRFWGLALAAVHLSQSDEPHLQVIEESSFSRERQIAENIQREDNTAVDRARAAAGLLLLQLGIEPDPSIEDDLDYFRQVHSYGRFPNGTWDPLEVQMKMSRTAMLRHLDILKLPSELVYLAKLHNLPEARMREVLAAPQERWQHLLLLAIESNFTAEELRITQVRPETARTRSARPKPGPHEKASGRIRALVKLTGSGAFGGDYERAANAYSAGAKTPKELLNAAAELEQLAHWLRILHGRRSG
jgi:hypothetical protein